MLICQRYGRSVRCYSLHFYCNNAMSRFCCFWFAFCSDMCNNDFGSLYCYCCVGLHSCYRIRFFLGVAYPVAVFYWCGRKVNNPVSVMLTGLLLDVSAIRGRYRDTLVWGSSVTLLVAYCVQQSGRSNLRDRIQQLVALDLWSFLQYVSA